jgi:hypothetical protein
LSPLYRVLPVVLPILGCAAGSAASTSGGPSPADDRVIIVQVNNNLTPPSVVTVRVEAVSGARIVLGTVPPGVKRPLRFKESMFATEFQLVAVQADGTTVTSRTFQLYPQAVVFWSLRDNMVAVSERDQ